MSINKKDTAVGGYRGQKLAKTYNKLSIKLDIFC